MLLTVIISIILEDSCETALSAAAVVPAETATVVPICATFLDSCHAFNFSLRSSAIDIDVDVDDATETHVVVTAALELGLI